MISFDGGRYQVLDRGEEATASRIASRSQGKRRKGQHWKESRVACVMSMEGTTHQSDPLPQLPDFLAGGSELQRKLTEIGHVMSLPDSASESSGKAELPVDAPASSASRSRTRPP